MSEELIRQELDPENAALLTPETTLPPVSDESYPLLKEALATGPALAKEAAEASNVT